MRQWALLSRKTTSRVQLLWFIVAQEVQQTFLLLVALHILPRSYEKEAFGSSLGIITGSNPLLKASKADISLLLYTLTRSAILTHFAPG